MNDITDHEIDRLAWHIETNGLAGLDDALRRMVQRARRDGASPVLIGVLADASAPEVVRIRAFGLVALQVANRRRQPIGRAA